MNRELLEAGARRFVLPTLKSRALAVRYSGVAKSISNELWKQQREFVADPAREKSLLCPRRAGKTEALIRYKRMHSLLRPGIVQYWAITRLRAKQLVWPKLKEIDARHGLKEGVDVEYNETELTSRLDGGGEIRLLGADKEKETEKKRGDSVSLAIVDESQLFGAYLKKLNEDVIGPSLTDLLGTLINAGTPGVVRAGHWNQISDWTLPPEKRVLGFSNHRWSAKDNVAVPHLWAEFLALKAKRGWADDNPTWRREYLGEWVDDVAALFYAFDYTLNTFSESELVPAGAGWSHVLGWDLGHSDDMAIVVWAFHPKQKALFEAYSWKKPGALVDEVAAKVKELQRRFNIIAQVADTGGGGAMFVAEVAKRHSLHFDAAKKTEKGKHVRLFNDDLRTGRLKLALGSPYQEEMAVLPKDPDWDPHNSTGAEAAEDPRFANHCCDAGLYAWRRALHFLHEDDPIVIAPGTAEAFKQTEDALEEQRISRLSQRANQEWWEQ